MGDKVMGLRVPKDGPSGPYGEARSAVACSCLRVARTHGGSGIWTADRRVEVKDSFDVRADGVTVANREGNTEVSTRTKTGNSKGLRAVVLGLFFVFTSVFATSALAGDLPVFNSLTSLVSPSDGTGASSDESTSGNLAAAGLSPDGSSTGSVESVLSSGWDLGATSAAASLADPNRYIVTFEAGVSSGDQAAALALVGAVEVSAIDALRMHVVTVPDAAAASTLEADSTVARVEADAVRAAGAAPSDTRYADQWALPQIGWDAARDAVTPAGSATVAILDTGVDASHPDLDANLVAGTSILAGGDSTTDPNGHGTEVAGIVAAETDNGAGVAGVGYAGVKVMPVTVLGADGTGQDSDIIEGVVWAADHGADVILMSFSNPGYSASLQAAVDYAWSKNVVLVAATGNGGSSEPSYPAGDTGVIGVASTDAGDALSLSSNYGAGTFLAAPGESILTTTAGGGYGVVSGTSASAAIVAGSAALLRASSFGASNGVIASRLAKTAAPAGSVDQTGNGRVDLGRAILDTSDDSVQPLGAPGGGPFIGPYVAAAAISASVTFPVNNGVYNTAGFDAGNGTPAGDIGGSVVFNTNSASRTLGVSIKQNSGGQYWGGAAFDAGTTEVFNSVCGSGTCTTGNSSVPWAYVVSAPAEGSYVVHAKATDDGGTSTTSDLTFTIDNTNPITASGEAPANSAIYSASTVPTSFSGKVADNAGGAGLLATSTTVTLRRNADGLYWNGTSFSSASPTNLAVTSQAATTGNTEAAWSKNSGLPTWSGQNSGAYTVQAKATDKAGNSFTGTAITFTLDNTAPTAAITYSPTAPVKAGTSLLITATFSEPMVDSPAPKIAISGANALAATNMTKVDSTHYTYTHTVGAGNGTATVALSVGTDLVGNVVTSAPTSGSTFTVDNTAPTAAITYAPSSREEGQSLTITATF